MLHCKIEKNLERGSNIPAWLGGLTGLQINENVGHKIFNIFLFTSLNICFGAQKILITHKYVLVEKRENLPLISNAYLEAWGHFSLERVVKQP